MNFLLVRPVRDVLKRPTSAIGEEVKKIFSVSDVTKVPLHHLQPTPIYHLQPTLISISIFSPKIEKLYYKSENAPMYASIIEFLYL